MEKERYLKYVKICERTERMKIDTGDRMGALMDIESASRSVTFGHVRCANTRLIVRKCISQRIVMESRSDWCVTDAIRESCQKDMTVNITQRQTNRLRMTIESRNGQQSPVCVG